MNKFFKLLKTCLLVCGMIITVSSCSVVSLFNAMNSSSEPFVPPESEGGKVTINDAYDWNEDGTGSTRPELGDGYTPSLPQKDAVITISEDSSIRFVGGATSITVPLGNVLKAESFDPSTLGGHRVGGLAILGEDGKIRQVSALSNFAAMSNVTVIPYFAGEHGDTYAFASDKFDHTYNSDGSEFDLTRITNEYTVLDGYLATRVNVSGSLTKDSYFRGVTPYAREEGQQYTYYYTFTNFGTEEISFTAYQMDGGSAWKDASKVLASQTVTLAAGATSDLITLNATWGKTDTNSLTLIKMEKDVNNLSIGVSMEIKNSTAREPATITLDLPAGFTVSGYQTNVHTNDKLVLPTAAQITNATGHNLLGWVYADGTTVVEGVRIQGNITIKPVLTEDAIITLNLPDGITVSKDYVTKLQTGDKLTLPTAEQITNTLDREILYWVDGEGKKVSNSTLVLGDMTIAPMLAQPVTVNVQLPKELTLSSEYVAEGKLGANLVLPTAAQITGTPVDGRTILGWYDVESGEIVTNSTTLDSTEITIAPYFSVPSGYTYAALGAGAHSGYNPDLIPGDITEHIGLENSPFSYVGASKGGTTAVAGNAVVVELEDGYAVLGSIVSDSAAVTAGSVVRFDTPYATALTEDTVVEFHYTVVNRGTSTLKLNIYHISASAEYKVASGYYAYESRYRMEINLAPGESTNAVGQYLLGANANMLTYIVFEQDVDTFDMGLALAYKIVDGATDVEEKYQNQAAYENPVTIAYDASENGGIEVSADYLTQRAGKFIVAPTSEQYTLPENGSVIGWKLVIGEKEYDLASSISGPTHLRLPSSGATLKAILPEGVTVNYQTANGVSADDAKVLYKTGETLELPALTATTMDGRKHVGWYDVATNNAVTNETVVMGDMTIAPYFTVTKGTALTPLSGATENEAYGPDNMTGFEKGNFSKSTAIVVDEMGIVLHTAVKGEKDYAFRFKTSATILANATYTFNYTFANYGKEEISFTVYQIITKWDTTGMPSETVTLGVGESKKVSLTLSFTASNGNALTYFVLNDATNGFDLGVAMSFVDKNEAEHVHTEEIVKGKPATCTEKGLTDGKKCSVCGETILEQEEIPALGHKEETVAGKPATCTEKGLTDGKKCSVCGETILAQEEIPALGHKEETVAGKPATCTEKGLTDGKKCSVCGETILAQEEIPALGHSYKAELIVEGAKTAYEIGESFDTTNLVVKLACANCDYTEEVTDYTLSKKDDLQATDGQITVSYVKGEVTYSAVININVTHTHVMGEFVPAVEATCTTAGNVGYYQCETCKNYYADKAGETALNKIVVDALGHDEVEHEGRGATCTEKGFEAYVTCTRCDYTTYKEIDALGHDEVEHQGQDATCVEKGYEAYVTCSRCDYTTYKEINALGHDEVEHEGQEPTYTEKGWKAYVTCTRCDYTTYEELPVKSVKINVELPEGLTLSSDYVAEVKYGDTLVTPTAEQVEGTIADGRTILGWYNVANNEIVTASTVVETTEITIAPYFSAPSGYTYVALGAGAIEGYNYDLVPGDITEHIALADSPFSYVGASKGGKLADGTVVPAGNAVVVEADGGYAVLGSTLSDSEAVTAGSAVRFDTPYATALTANTVVEFYYTVVNRGSSTLKLNIYQISGSSEYKEASGYYAYESRYRVEINLAPGESTNAVGQYLLGKNGNMLTYVVFEQDVDAFDMGLALSYKIVSGATNVEEKYQNQAAYENPVTIAYDASENGGIEVSADYLTQRAGKFIVAPTSEQYTLPENANVIGWKLVIGEKEYDLASSISGPTHLRLPSSGAMLKAVLPEGVTVSYQTVNGVSADGVKTLYQTGETLELPALAERTTDGRAHLGWYDVATGKTLTAETVVMGEMTVAPYFEAKANALTPLSGALSGDAYGPDRMTGFVNGDFSKETAVIGGELGIILHTDVVSKAANAFRFKTSMAVVNNITYTFNYVFTNFGEETLGFNVYQVVTGMETSGMPTEEVVLGVGESKNVSLTIKFEATNTNALTYFVLNTANNGFDLGVSMSYDILPESVTVVYQTANGVSADDAKTSYLKGEKLVFPALTETTTDGRTQLGWYNVATLQTVADGAIVNDNMTLAPYFAPNGTALTPLSGATSGDKYGPDNMSTNFKAGNFSKSTAIVGDELGIILHTSVAVPVDSSFRFKTAVSLTKGTSYTFTYIFKNFGEEDVSFTVYQVTSGTTTENMENSTVTLKAGEVMTVTLSVTLPGNNGNALTYFVMKSASSGLDLGVAMSYKVKA